MLRIEITTPDCEDNESYHYFIRMDASWEDIKKVIEIVYPDATSVFISLIPEDKG